MLAEMVDHVVGVDPDRDRITAAVVDAATTGVVATARFPANGSGYREAMAWADEHSTATERAWAVDTSSYGRGVAAAPARSGEWVIEFDRAKEKATKDGAKIDALDAVRAARETLGRDKWAVPRVHDGIREALRVHAVARDSAVQARTAAINELKAFVVTAPDHLRDDLRGLTRRSLVKRCAGFRHSDKQPIDQTAHRRTVHPSGDESSGPADSPPHRRDQRPREDTETPRRGGCTSAPRGVRTRHRSSSLRCLVTSRPVPQRSRLERQRRSAVDGVHPLDA